MFARPVVGPSTGSRLSGDDASSTSLSHSACVFFFALAYPVNKQYLLGLFMCGLKKTGTKPAALILSQK
jgi:hypothetical protein